MPSINMHVGDGFVMLEPTVPEAITKALKYWARSITFNMKSRRRVIEGAYKYLYEERTTNAPSGDVINQLYTMFGFTAKCMTILQKAGYEVKYIDERTPFPAYDLDKAMLGLRDYQFEAVWTALNAGGGILSCPTGYGKTILMKSIIAAYDKKDLIYRNTPLSVVAAADMDICRKNYNDLCSLFGKEREVGIIMTGYNKRSDDIQVITFDSLHKINPDEVGICIADEVHTAATERRSELIMGLTKARKWGVSATPMGRFDGGDLVTEGLFGPIIYSSTYQEGVISGALVPLSVFWLPTPEPDIGVPAYRRYKTRAGKYTRGVVLNKRLSRLVVDLLHAIPESMQTLCIMQFLQQMNELCQLDNTLKIVHGEMSEEKLKSNRYHDLCAVSKEERRTTYDKMANGEIKKLLSTYIYKQGVNFPGLSVVICPGGGGSELIAGQIPGRASRAGVAGKDHAYIIDFDHAWDIDDAGTAGPLLRDDKSRARTYKKLGFNQYKINNINELPFIEGADSDDQAGN